MYVPKWAKATLKVGSVVLGIKFVEVLLVTSGCYGVNNHIKRHLNSDAVHCNFLNNAIGYFNVNVGLPRMQNCDVNKDGRLESILLCNVKNGVKAYQIVRLDNNGVETFSPLMYGKF